MSGGESKLLALMDRGALCLRRRRIMKAGKGNERAKPTRRPGRARIDEGSPPPYLVRSSFDKRVVLDKGPALAGSVLRLVGVVGVFLALDISFFYWPCLPTPLF